LAADTDSDYYLKFGFRIVPTSNAFQAAIDLFQDGRVDPKHVLQVADRMIKLYDYSTEELELSYDDLIRRGRLSDKTDAQLSAPLKSAGILSVDYNPSVPPRRELERSGRTLVRLEGSFDPWVVDSIDYVRDYR